MFALVLWFVKTAPTSDVRVVVLLVVVVVAGIASEGAVVVVMALALTVT